MCLIALAIDQHRRFPLVLAANRDEFHDRPAAPLGWWSRGKGSERMLSGRDLMAGGTWLGLNAGGRLAMVTNARRSGDAVDPQAPSRGGIVPLWLDGGLEPDRFWMRVALNGYNPFNLIAADLLRGECFWASDRSSAPVALERSLIGLSNAALDTPWPKTLILKHRLAEALREARSADALAVRMFAALADRTPAADVSLPLTGIDPALEKQLSSAFVQTADRRYGTRCSTIVLTERVERRMVAQVYERTFDFAGKIVGQRRATLGGWPPRSEDGVEVQAEIGEVIEQDLSAPEFGPQRHAGASDPFGTRLVGGGVLQPAQR